MDMVFLWSSNPFKWFINIHSDIRMEFSHDKFIMGTHNGYVMETFIPSPS